ncbi:MAG: UDP-3-O-(3-hydroxymyristoyl)glucosamine N-acyltransferase [Planctomycetes bacterium]|nr:UDP-3-O-(3-hydroxymyristoyl)glucosamine N-acyltransferase [Planctomycetota bacterium]
MSMTLEQLARTIGATIRGAADPNMTVERCVGLEEAGASDISFLANPKYIDQLAATKAAAVIVAPDVKADHLTLLTADDPYFAFRNAVVALHGYRQHPAPADGPISKLAVIHPTAKIGEGTVVHPFAVISENVAIGARGVIYPHTFIGPDTIIGDDCQLYPNVVIYDRCVLGHRVTLHAGCVIGQDGFGYATHKGAHHKIPQSGNVVIEDDVEMGAGCAIDRATLGSTVIGKGTKFSDLIAIGHGTKVGKHNLLVALVGLAGSVETGDYVVMGGQVGVAGHLKIGHQVQIAATSGVMNDIPDKTQIGGTPAVPLTEAKRIHLHTMRLPDLAARLKKLEREIEKLRNES